MVLFSALLIWRLGFFQSWWQRQRRKKDWGRVTLIIGAGEKAFDIYREFEQSIEHDFRCIGFIETEKEKCAEQIPEHLILGTYSDRLKILGEQKVECVIVSTQLLSNKERIELVEECLQKAITVEETGDSFQIVRDNWELDEYAGVQTVRFRGARYDPQINISKRVLDIIGAGLGLVILSLLLLVIALLIKFTSKGPVIYRQKRIGKDGKEFIFYKFRSMRIEGEERDGSLRQNQYLESMEAGKPMGKIVNKNRITTVGRFLRDTSLDELPQFWSVVKGDMSLVGPRPCLPYEYELYQDWHRKRFAVLPGCTGIWQVSERLKVSFEDMILLDFFYLENMSVLFDMKILIKTIPQMLLSKSG